jgi:hypothetical protein
MKNTFFGIFTLIALCVSSNIFAQTPAQIDVTSITIHRVSNIDAYFTVTANGLPATYESPLTGRGEALNMQMERCSPCDLGAIFPTDYVSGLNPPRFINGFNIGGSDNKRVKFTVTGTSPDIILSPRIRLKNRSPILTVPARITGKIEIFNQNTLVAVDNDVDLAGTLKAEFVAYRGVNLRRFFDFKSFTFTYSQ